MTKEIQMAKWMAAGLLLLAVESPGQVVVDPYRFVGGGGGGGGSTILTGLNAYYAFDEASGNATDSLGVNNLTDNNTVAATTGKINNGRLFVSANFESLSHVSSAAFAFGDSSFAISFWVYLIDDTHTSFFVSKDDSGVAGHRNYAVFYSTSADRFGFIVFTAGDTQNRVDANTLGSPALNTWYHIVAMYDAAADTMSIRVNNGTADTTGSVGPLQADGGENFVVGASSGANYADARMDELLIEGRTLTGTEISKLYASGSGLSYPF